MMSGLATTLRNELYEFAMSAGMRAVAALQEEDRVQLCGNRYERSKHREAHRAGHVDGELAMGGRRVAVSRPRVRSEDGREISQPKWQAFAAEDPLNRRAAEQTRS